MPRKMIELRSLLDLAGHYRRFIKDFAGIYDILHDETNGSKKFNWKEEIKEEFEVLKEKLTSTPVLEFHYFDALFIAETDPSSVAVGAVIS